MKQKWLPLLLVPALMISMLSACGSGSQSAAESGEQSAHTDRPILPENPS